MTSYAFAETPQPKTTDEALNKLAKAHKITKPEDVEDYKKRVRQHIAERKQANKDSAKNYFLSGLLGFIAGITIDKINGKTNITTITNELSIFALAYGAYNYLRLSPDLDHLRQKLDEDTKK